MPPHALFGTAVATICPEVLISWYLSTITIALTNRDGHAGPSPARYLKILLLDAAANICHRHLSHWLDNLLDCVTYPDRYPSQTIRPKYRTPTMCTTSDYRMACGCWHNEDYMRMTTRDCGRHCWEPKPNPSLAPSKQLCYMCSKKPSRHGPPNGAANVKESQGCCIVM